MQEKGRTAEVACLLGLTPSRDGTQKYRSPLYLPRNLPGTGQPQTPPGPRMTFRSEWWGKRQESPVWHGILRNAWILEADRQTWMQTLALPLNSRVTMDKSVSLKLLTFSRGVTVRVKWDNVYRMLTQRVLHHSSLSCQVSQVTSEVTHRLCGSQPGAGRQTQFSACSCLLDSGPASAGCGSQPFLPALSS